MKRFKILEFFSENNGQLSSTRLFSFLIVASAIIDWQYAIWHSGVWSPAWTTISLVAGVLGIKAFQKQFEAKVDTKHEEETKTKTKKDESIKTIVAAG